jgi:hypothetical protein
VNSPVSKLALKIYSEGLTSNRQTDRLISEYPVLFGWTRFIIFCLSMAIVSGAQAGWSVDFSRRVQSSREDELRQFRAAERAPANVKADGDPGFLSNNTEDSVLPSSDQETSSSGMKGVFDTVFETSGPIQDVVILNTDRGFVPSTVRVRKNARYRVHVVNVNEKEKNVSFILDGFSEHHATYYGKTKSFMLDPKKEGTYSFQSPETAAEGRLIVFNPQISLRSPASESASEDNVK